MMPSGALHVPKLALASNHHSDSDMEEERARNPAGGAGIPRHAATRGYCERNFVGAPVSGVHDEAATAKLWGVYVSEAEAYDKALVESWRGDMEGMLIFAGLFSASLTAFLIESYKTLEPDTGDTTVLLLKQILAHISASVNGSAVPIPSATSTFTPPATSLVCNTFWFLSLGLSLSCALIATLVEQWAREFLHKSNMHSDPVARARILACLYYGLKRFNMHAVVEVIPLLLHSSLFFFLAGLVAFLLPVNLSMSAVAAALLCFVAGIYAYLTVLPIVHTDCPYRTPITGAAWRILKDLEKFYHPRRSRSTSLHSTKSMIKALALQATEPSHDRAMRDKRALAWMVTSLKNERDLELLLEAIPDVIWGPKGRRRIHDVHIDTLSSSPDVNLWPRIRIFLRSCDSGLLSLDAETRRRITCYKAFWTLSSLSSPDEDQNNDYADAALFDLELATDSQVISHLVSARALAAWKSYCAFKTSVLDGLEQDHADSTGRRGFLNLHLKHTAEHSVFTFLPSSCRDKWVYYIRKFASGDNSIIFSAESMSFALQKLCSFGRQLPHAILFDYLHRCATLDAPPYQFQNTISTIHLDRAEQLSSPIISYLHSVFTDIVTLHLDTMNSTPSGIHRIDNILSTLVSFCHKQAAIEPAVPHNICAYLNRRNSDAALEQLVRKRKEASFLWTALSTALARVQVSSSDEERDKLQRKELLMSIWRLCVLPSHPVVQQTSCEAALHAIAHPDASHSPAVTSLIPLVTLKIFDALRYNHTARMRKELESQLQHPALPDPSESAVVLPTDFNLAELTDEVIDAQLDPLYAVLCARIAEGRVRLLAAFLVRCASSETSDKAGPFDPAKTVCVLGAFAPTSPVHPLHQTRFAESFRAFLPKRISRRRHALLTALLNIEALDVYAASADTERSRAVGSWLRNQPWLDDPHAREVMKVSLSECSASLQRWTEMHVLSDRIDRILYGLDFLHREMFYEADETVGDQIQLDAE